MEGSFWLNMSLEAGARSQNFATGILKRKVATGRKQEFQLLCLEWAKIFLPENKQTNKATKQKPKTNQPKNTTEKTVTMFCR